MIASQGNGFVHTFVDLGNPILTHGLQSCQKQEKSRASMTNLDQWFRESVPCWEARGENAVIVNCQFDEPVYTSNNQWAMLVDERKRTLQKYGKDPRYQCPQFWEIVYGKCQSPRPCILLD